jgi:hypothetical protein
MQQKNVPEEHFFGTRPALPPYRQPINAFWPLSQLEESGN